VYWVWPITWWYMKQKRETMAWAAWDGGHCDLQLHFLQNEFQLSYILLHFFVFLCTSHALLPNLLLFPSLLWHILPQRVNRLRSLSYTWIMGHPCASPLPSYGSTTEHRHVQAPSRIQAFVPVYAEPNDVDIDCDTFLSISNWQ